MLLEGRAGHQPLLVRHLYRWGTAIGLMLERLYRDGVGAVVSGSPASPPLSWPTTSR
jgi:hypothetical protein